MQKKYQGSNPSGAHSAQTTPKGEQFGIGVVLKEARETAGLTQEELAHRLKTKKTPISRIENHAEDIKLSALEKVAHALRRRLEVKIA